jgi:hypothetical protein
MRYTEDSIHDLVETRLYYRSTWKKLGIIQFLFEIIVLNLRKVCPAVWVIFRLHTEGQS